MQESLEYQIGQDGKTVSLIEDLGIVIDVPPGAIPNDHLDDVTVRINACVSGPFELPDGFELASPIFHIEPGAKFAEKPVELSMVHFIDIGEEEHCSELKFVSAPLKQSSRSEYERKEIRFKPLDGGMFWPGRRMGKILLQHFCLIGIARLKREKGEERVTPDTVESSSFIRPKPAIPSKFMIKIGLVDYYSMCVHNCNQCLSNVQLYKLLSWECHKSCSSAYYIII